MPASLITRSLTVTRGELTVVSSVDLTLSPGRCVGVVGPNGIGKSTLLRALAGLVDDPTSAVEGAVERAPASATVGYLPQEPRLATPGSNAAQAPSTEVVLDFVLRRTGVAAAQAALDAATTGLAEGTPGADDAYSDALERWLGLGSADVDTRIAQVFAELSIPDRLLDQQMPTLSGGEAARVSLASMLLSRFDVVLLDEPTNDLDLDGLDRLERWVTSLDQPSALVSHDRAFLARTVTDVVEIDHHSRTISFFAGGWTAFLTERELARERSQQRYDEYDTKRQGLLNRSQREREWATQGAAKVKKSGENDKHIRNFKMNQTEQLAGRAARTQKAIERLDQNEGVEEPRTAWDLRYTISTVERSGDVVVTVNGAVVRRGGFQLGPLDLDVRYGDRIAIVGGNGSGKSTLIDLLLARRVPDIGSSTLGSGVVLGEIEQARDGFVGDAGLLDAFCAATGPDVATARTLLAKFGLGPSQMGRPGSTLSPGERTRAAMAVLMANGANLLVFDEPTNHLDLVAIEQLEAALDDFSGTVLLVSHDRELLRAVRFDRVLRVADGRVTEQPLDVLDPDGKPTGGGNRFGASSV